MPKGTLADAAAYVGALAEQLTALSLLIAMNDKNAKELQADATQCWVRSSAGWSAGSPRYLKRKMAIAGTNEPGVLSGGWKAFRTLHAAEVDYVYRKTKSRKLALKSVDYTSRQNNVRRPMEGRKKSQKPWRNYPQRFVDVGNVDFACRAAAVIRGSNAATIQAAQKELPLNNMMGRLTKGGAAGRKIGTIKRGKVKINAALQRAVNNAI